MFAKVLMIEGMKVISLNKGASCKIDDSDYEEISKYKWYLSDTGYPCRTQNGKRSGGKREPSKRIFMHRSLMNCPKGMVVDHINHDRTDNRRENLRICSVAENVRNSPTARFRNVFKGVYKMGNRYKSSISYYGVQIHIGMYGTPTEAAQAYDVAAEHLFGEFAEPTNS